jgi:hypothetical protein
MIVLNKKFFGGITMAKEKVKKPFYKKWWVWTIAVIIIAAATSGGEEEPVETASADVDTEQTDSNEAATDEATAEEKEEPKKEEEKKDEVKTAKIGETATVSDVGFTVESVEETNEIDSGNEFIENATTEGKFVIVTAKIENGKKEALTIDSSYFKIKTSDDVEYEPTTDGEVIMAMGDGAGDFFLQQINPGLSKSGKVVFEVPADFNLAETVLYCQTGFFGTESIEISLSE